MPAESQTRIGPNVVIGAGIMLLGIALLLERLGVVDAQTLLQLWPLLLIFLGASLVLLALWGDRDGSRDSGIGGLWVVVVILALVAWQAQRRGEAVSVETQAEVVSVVAILSGDHQTSLAAPLRRGDMTSVLGRARLDLRQAAIAPGEEAVVEVFAFMGGAVVHVPRDWEIDMRAVSILGGIRDERARPPDDTPEDDSPPERRRIRHRTGAIQGPETLEPLDPPAEGSPPARVVLRGSVMMGHLTIRS